MIVRRPLLLALALAACDDPEPYNPPQLEDQSGAVFDWSCNEQRCFPKPIDGVPALPECGPNGLKPGYSYTWGLYINIAAMCADGSGGWGSFPEWSRTVVCESDADCPTIPHNDELDAYECNAGFCKLSSAADRFDELPLRHHMSQLCLGHVPRYEPYEVTPELDAALAAACPGESDDSPCVSVPEGCPDPRG